MLRSSEMEYFTLHMRETAAASVIERLGQLGTVQFTDLQGDLTTFKRHYTPQIRRCDELEKKLFFFAEEMRKTNTPTPEPRSQEAFLLWRGEQARMAEHYGCPLLDYWESIISERHKDYQALRAEREKNAAVLASAGARRHVIEAAVKWFDVDVVSEEGGGKVGGAPEPFRGAGLRAPGSSAAALEAGKAAPTTKELGDGEDVSFRYFAGILRHEDQARFARIVFRASVGHAAVRFAPIESSLMDEKGETGKKAVFAVLYRGKALAPKLERICSAFGAQTHTLPNFTKPEEVREALRDTKAIITTTIAWMKGSAAMAAHTLGHLRLVLMQWRMGVAREKACFVALNGLTRNPQAGTVSGAGWVLKSESSRVMEAIEAAHVEAAGGARVLPYRVDLFSVMTIPAACERFGCKEETLENLRVAGAGDYIGLPEGAGRMVHHQQQTHHAHLPGPGSIETPFPAEGYIGVAAREVNRECGLPGVNKALLSKVLVLPSSPPTFFPVNKVTSVFQGIVNTYGMPRYQEANPALFTIMTFPFLFGVMFGDFGHALFLTLASAWMVWKEDTLASVDNEIFGMAFGGRYMLLMMGFFSLYCGLIYNDFFSLGMTVMGQSRWSFPTLPDGTQSRFAVTSGAAEDVYKFGIDPAWHLSENSLLFFNSLKMKMSVVLGITQMTFGLILRCSNALYYRSKVDFWFEAVPQVIFMVSLFGYMVFLIMAKWCINWFGGPSESPGSPPSLIDTLINIALKPSSIDPPDKMFAGQGSFQQFVLFVAFLTVPVMLFAKPYFLSRPKEGEEGKAKSEDGHGHGGGGHHSFGELFIHQAIETIEFVLGTVSNTASYLRLWALSLAHSQLATVFWERALVASVQTESFFYIVIGYSVFSGITTGVLLIMDVLECFLHALRLHWVEFQVRDMRLVVTNTSLSTFFSHTRPPTYPEFRRINFTRQMVTNFKHLVSLP